MTIIQWCFIVFCCVFLAACVGWLMWKLVVEYYRYKELEKDDEDWSWL